MIEKNKGFNLWDYLYYRTTLWYSKNEKSAGFEYNKDTGAYAVTAAIFFNFYGVLLILIARLIPEYFITFSKNDYFVYLIVALAIVHSIVVSLIMKKRHQKIFEMYESETEKQRDKRGALLVVYVISSILIFFITAYFLREILLG